MVSSSSFRIPGAPCGRCGREDGRSSPTAPRRATTNASLESPLEHHGATRAPTSGAHERLPVGSARLARPGSDALETKSCWRSIGSEALPHAGAAKQPSRCRTATFPFLASTTARWRVGEVRSEPADQVGRQRGAKSSRFASRRRRRRRGDSGDPWQPRCGVSQPRVRGRRRVAMKHRWVSKPRRRGWVNPLMRWRGRRRAELSGLKVRAWTGKHDGTPCGRA